MPSMPEGVQSPCITGSRRPNTDLAQRAACASQNILPLRQAEEALQRWRSEGEGEGEGECECGYGCG